MSIPPPKTTKSGLDLDLLRQEIRVMQYWSPVYKVLKEELSKVDHWKNRKRGKPRSF